LSQPVIVGLSTGAGATIIASQVPAVAGVRANAGSPILDVFDVVRRPAEVDPAALLSAATVILLLVALPRLNRRMPTPLLALVAGGVVAALLGGVDVVTLQQPVLGVSWTQLAPGDVVALSVPAAVLALVGFSEASAIARRYATQDRSRWDPNRELLGQGAASLGAGIVGGFPISGSFARTSLARLAGARTRGAAITSGLLILALVPFISWLPPIPSPALGAVVMAAGVSLIDVDGLRRLYQSAPLQFAVAAGTLAATLVFSPRIDIAVLVGMGLAAAVHMFREEQLRIVTNRNGRDVRLVVEGVVFFASAPRLGDAVSDSVAAGGVDHVEIDLSGAGRVDVTGVLTIADALDDLAEAGITAWVSGVPAHAERLVARLLDARFLRDPNAEHAADA
jgi:sulfate permease, SulP family